MAADLVKGKNKKAKATSSQVTPRKSSRISDLAGKRKAAEDVSPESVKKRKPASSDAAAEPEKKKSKKADKKQSKKEAKPAADAEEQESAENEVAEEADDSTKALVQTIDSGDEDDAAGGASLFQPGQDVGKAPVAEAAKHKKSPKTKSIANGTTDGESTDNGIIYVGRIPHGFFEHEMRSYFSQFGDIRNLRLSRNRKTGASKHYAFIQFEDTDVAEIVAKTMDNYLLFGHLLRCSVVSPENVPANLFKGANRRFKTVPWNLMAGRQLSKPRPETKWSDKISKETKRRKGRAAELQEKLGYTFKAPAIKSADTIEAPVETEGAEQEEKTDEAEPAQKAITNGKDKTEEAVTEAVAAAKTAAPKAKKAKAKKSAKV